MRPKLLNCLKAVYKKDDTKENNSSPFVSLMKNISEIWFKTLFSTVLPFKALTRVIDYFLIFGFEFIHKFGLAYLSKKEKFIINSIKIETKTLKLGASVDALIMAGNLTKAKLLYKAENFDVEPLIKKCMKKETYLKLNRFDYLSKAVIIESKASERIFRLKKAKAILDTCPLNVLNALEIINCFTTDVISRQAFYEITQKVASWDSLISNSIFTLFDQNGDEQIERSKISIGISLLVSDVINERLNLCFQVFDTDKSGYLSSAELSEMVIIIESALDGRSSFYQREAENLMRILDSNNDSKISIEEFKHTVMSNKIFKPILDYINLIESDEEMLQENGKNEYIDIHSPLSLSINFSEDGSGSDNLVEQNILEAEVDYQIPDFKQEEIIDLEDKIQ